ncbi:Vacuolar morphogenesis protein 6 [Agyrium rufum]|nr:Vacuolar morphogenesis protein 6 [Agyrium rufum]
MLSAFTARPIVELKQRDKSRIESVLVYGDRLLVGLSTGSLRVYRVIEPDQSLENEGDGDGTSSKAKAVELLQEHEKFSKHKIEQLARIKEANLAIALSNGFVSFYDLQTFQLQETLAKTKGASAFAVTSDIVKDASTGVPSIVSRLAVAVKRRLLLWSWHDSELSEVVNELTLVTGIKTLTWATGTRLIAGLTSSFVLVDVESSEITDIVGPGSIGGAPGQDGGRLGAVGVASIGYMGMGGTAPKPLTTRLGNGQLLLAKDINTLFIDADGNSLGKRQIPWSVAPEAIGYSYPYLLALQATKGQLEVRNPETLSSLQSISLPNANQIHFSPPNVSLAHAGKGFLVSSERCIWRMHALSYDDQIDALAVRHRYDEAISIMGMLESALMKDKEGRLREVKMLKAQVLFDAHRYRDALDLFNEVDAPPERVIRLYPESVTGNLEIEGTANLADDTEDTPDATASEGATTKSGDATNAAQLSSSPRKLLKEPSGKAGSDTASIRSKSDMDVDKKNMPEGKDLRFATMELASFLVGVRTKMKKFLNDDGTLKEASETTQGQEGSTETRLENLLIRSGSSSPGNRHEELIKTAKLVDTTLFRAYMLAAPSLVGSLFRLPNFCDSEVVNAKLQATGRFNDLIDFFYGKRLHEEALELLQKFGHQEEDDGNESLKQLRGPQRTVEYLQNLSPKLVDLILKYAEWPLRSDADMGMEIFLVDTKMAAELPRNRVLDFLQGIDRKLAVKYLKHIIFELEDTTSEFHERLIEVYLKGLKDETFANESEKTKWKENLLDFLRTSKHYESWKLIRQLNRDDPDLYEARAIVLGNMGEHRQALDIYVFKLNDPQKAEDYCNQIYLVETAGRQAPPPTTQTRSGSIPIEDDGPPSIYHVLLALYLSPPSPHKAQWQPALEILAKHGSRLPASSTLSLIPEVLPIKELESYFRARIRSANARMNEGQVVAGLMKATDDYEESKLRLGDEKTGFGGRNRRVVITEERVCPVCHKRFGGSAIKVLPNNSVVHYGCSSQ